METNEGTDIILTTHRFSLPGYPGDPGFLCDLLSTVESSTNSSSRVSIAALEARWLHIEHILIDAQNKGLRDVVVQELNLIDDQILRFFRFKVRGLGFLTVLS